MFHYDEGVNVRDLKILEVGKSKTYRAAIQTLQVFLSFLLNGKSIPETHAAWKLGLQVGIQVAPGPTRMTCHDMCSHGSSGNATTGKGGSIPKCKVIIQSCGKIPNHLSPGRGNCEVIVSRDTVLSDMTSKSTNNKVVSHEQC